MQVLQVAAPRGGVAFRGADPTASRAAVVSSIAAVVFIGSPNGGPARKVQGRGPRAIPCLMREPVTRTPRQAMTRFKQLTLAALAAALGTASITCGGGTTQPATPTAIAMASGDGQTGAVGSTLAHPLSWRSPTSRAIRSTA